MDESSNATSTKPATTATATTTNTLSRNSTNNNKNADTPNNVDLAKKRNTLNNKDATIETLKSSTMHNNNNNINNKSSNNSNLGCGTPPSTIPETTILTTPTNCSVEDKILPITSKSNSNSVHGLDEKCLRNSSILTTTMAAASGLPLQQRPQQQPLINLQVSTTTGGNFGVTVDAQISVDTLKKLISKKLKVAKDRICLLHREKELQDGTLYENSLIDGSKIILIPNVETGLMAQRPENTVMQALESLNDSQVNDFLSGKTPLNLSMRLGDHMMLIQLQLSTVNPIGQTGSLSASNSNSHHHPHHHHHHHHHVCGYQRRSSLRASTNQLLTEQQLKIQQQKMQLQKDNTNNQEVGQNLCKPHQCNNNKTPTQSADCVDAPVKTQDTAADLAVNTVKSKSGVKRAGSPVPVPGPFKKSDLSAFFEKHDVKSLQSIVKNFNTLSKSANMPLTNTVLEQSPIKSLSNLVSNSTKPSTSIKNIPKTAATSNKPHTSTRSSHAFKSNLCACQESLTSRLTSCLCKRLHSATKNMLQSSSNSNATTLAIPANKSSALNTISICKIIDTDKVSAITIDSSKKVVEKKDTNRNAVNHFVPLNNNISLKQCLEANNIQMPMRPTQTGAPLGLLRICNHNNKETTATAVENVTDASATSSNTLHKTANNAINRAKQYRHHHQIQQLSSSAALAFEVSRNAQLSPRLPAAAVGTNKKLNDNGSLRDTPLTTTATATATATTLDESLNSITDTRTLAEASRNLTQTLRKLSKEVFTNKIDLTASNEELPRKTGSGAVIESMKNHGKGIYSGTFSGTLNPALQDRYGRPKRDISTVIHILNDLLSATPQYSRGARISLEAPAAVGSLSSTTASTKNKQFTLKPYHSCLKCLKSVHHIQHMPNGVCNASDCERVKRHSATLSCCIDAGNNGGSQRVENAQKERLCTCRYRVTEAGEREREQMCQKCVVEMENSKTKSKLDQLRLVMQQRKQKREARKLKESPYATRAVSPTSNNVATLQKADIPNIMASTNATILTPTKATLATSSAAPATNGSNTGAAGSEVPPNHIVEEVDTAA